MWGLIDVVQDGIDKVGNLLSGGAKIGWACDPTHWQGKWEGHQRFLVVMG
jgi:hypothetical protein